MRIGGLATGMDTENIIKDMMQAHRIPLDKITQKKQYLQWQLDDYRKTNRNLRDTGYKVTDTVGKQATFMQKTMNISNPDAVGIKATSATGEFSGSIEVTKLATQAARQGNSFFVSETDKRIVVNGKEFTATEFENATLKDLGIDGKSAISINAPGTKEAVNLEFEDSATLKSVLADINKKTGVSAFFDSGSGKIAVSAKNTGAGNIEIVGGQGGLNDLAAGLKLDAAITPGNSQSGSDAIFTFNGLTTERSSNTFTINGFEINLKQANSGPVTFNSAPDVDKVMESVVKFVDDYNKMIEELHAKIKEPVYRNFQPLSDEQKKDMKEKEIELWEEKAMSGTLRNDPTIASMLTKMRQMMSEKTDGTEYSLKDIGITPIKDFKENGKLEINETELRKAISENPNMVSDIFTKSASDTEKGGIAIQFRKTIDETNKVISTKAGSTGSVSDSFTLGRTMKGFEKQIERFEERLKVTENRYWKQFTAMENAIQRANAQSASLMSALGGGM
ncbi:flagellar filament capping protein FliD [Sporosarcina oncorhynchi]|uniref:Flagellar hook-associated protein 2 n=1 Tax=Sporosarcina oncorhynchi TaxID=3056444 RepID=A0ABZ0L749_9BACL|nr:flagellar filament capping protein FliD [Sporosarcina sp. T2O-4]WOV88390.1 flagellar filament capping protein FliD [Sporosarcina sp. T2O-4]